MSADTIEWFAKNWAVLASAPAVFASLAVIVCGGNHLGIVAGPGMNMAGLIKDAIEGTTKLKVSLNQPNLADSGEFIYLVIGINQPT